MRFHRLSGIFPLLEGEDFDVLVADIKANGQREAITTYEDQILDGRNRWRACQVAGIKPKIDTYTGNNPLGLILSLNIHRRHLDESQRAMVAAKLANMPQGARTDLKPSADMPEVIDQPKAAKMLNVSERSLRNAKVVIERGRPDLIRAVENGKVSVTTASGLVDLPPDRLRLAIANPKCALSVVKGSVRAQREEALGKLQCALPDKKYGVILADPEWSFQPWSRQSGMDRAADNHYPTSSLENIKARDVAKIAAADCTLFLWATQPMLDQAMDVIKAWGFTYKSNAVWVKDRISTGYWFRNRHEILLVGTCGDVPCPAMGEQWDSAFEAPRRGHSEKPELVLEMIEAYFPHLPRIELNRRGPPRKGWDHWGWNAEKGEPNVHVETNTVGSGLRSVG